MNRSLAALLLVAGCSGAAPYAPAPVTPVVTPLTEKESTAPTVDEAQAFVKDVNEALRALAQDADRAAWVKSTYITPDTEHLESKERDRVMEFIARKVKEARRFEGLDLPKDTARSLYLLKFSAGLPAPSDAKKRARLAELTTQLESIYGKGKYCSPRLKGKGDDKKSECLELDELGKVLSKEKDYDLLLEVWKGWHSISPPMRSMYEEFVAIGNEGAAELGFGNMADIWKGGYDMSSAEFEAEMNRLWTEVKPLYEKLHCFVRARLQKQHGTDKVKAGAPIPAHLLGNMWAQEWQALYPLVEPHKGKGNIDVTKQMVAKKWNHEKMVKTGEAFFTSLGMQPLPKTFWERSLFLKPKDRNVVCHASAWDVGLSGDLRIKMCINTDFDDLVTIHHELGHNYYYQQYGHLPPLFQAGANDGFHEGIGDTLVLSVTPDYLKKIGLLDKVSDDAKADLNVLMTRALEGVAFLPFGKLIDEWRWRVFDGRTPPSEYNKSWWELRRKYQGVAPAVDRSEKDFDPGAKYHIPANVPYTRYFIARILQYQFHRALCKAAGHTGPLYKCSIYGNAAAGKKMIDMLRLGASKEWPVALEMLSGEKRMDATAIIDYYAPLAAWLDEQNKGQKCGWD
ncbi:MAG: M2 family metallopeptidase [Myxococcales bacterium]|nr:M2 family metallopeptidase [Myxococcales bacterium]